MNDVQNLIDRQLGIFCRFNYDNILKRLVVNSEESFYGLQNSSPVANFDHDPPIFASRFSEASGYEHILALANEDGRVAIQDTSGVRAAGELRSFQCHNNAVFDLAWMPAHRSFVTVSGDHTACLWDVAEGAPKRVSVFSNHTRSVKTAVFPPTNPSVFATGARDGHILLWDIRASSQPSVVLKPDNCLMNCHSSFAPKTPGSHGKRPRLDNHRVISITGLVFQDDLTLVSCGECDGNIKVWDLRKNYNIYKREPLPKHSIPYCGSSAKNGYSNLIIDDARVRLYASCMDSVVYCFNVSAYSAVPERRYVGHENSTFYIKTCLSPDGAHLVSGSSDKHAYLWNVKCSEPVLKLSGHRAEVTCAAWRRRGDTALVTCSDDARHKLWRLGPELADDDALLRGRAEAVPRTDAASLPKWGAPDRTPGSLGRSSCGAKRARRESPEGRPVRRTKRCLADLMLASRCSDTGEGGSPEKRLKLDLSPIPESDEPKLLPAGQKRHRDDAEMSPPSKRRYLSDAACDGFMSPARNYEKRHCKLLSPKSPKMISPTASPARTPVKVSPSKVRVITFSTPTKDLPNYVANGEAPHLRLMSPARKKPDTTDWLTQIARGRRGDGSAPSAAAVAAAAAAAAPPSPRDGAPARRNSNADRAPKPVAKTRTLLKYFSVTARDART